MEGVKNLRLIALLKLCLVVSCGGDRPKTRYESPVSLDVNAPLDEGVCFRGRPIQERYCLPGQNRRCKQAGQFVRLISTYPLLMLPAHPELFAALVI